LPNGILFHTVIYGGSALKKSGSQDCSPLGGFSAGFLGQPRDSLAWGAKTDDEDRTLHYGRQAGGAAPVSTPLTRQVLLDVARSMTQI